MSASVDILFLDSQTLGQPESLEQIFQVLIEIGFKVVKVEVQNNVFNQDEYLDSVGEIMNLAYATKNLSFNAFNSDPYFEIFQQIAWGEQHLGATSRAYIRTSTINTAGFWREGYDNSYYSSFFLDIGKKLYQLVKPSFGWIDQYHGWTTTHEDIESFNLRMLYWANFFGPKFVQKLGRDRILNAPAWRIEELVDGGILYLLAPHLGLTDEQVPLESVKEYFGLESVR
jgi:hypothetical protein